eukprot:7070755-Pyramimonas_sp.AAC.1
MPAAAQCRALPSACELFRHGWRSASPPARPASPSRTKLRAVRKLVCRCKGVGVAPLKSESASPHPGRPQRAVDEVARVIPQGHVVEEAL